MPSQRWKLCKSEYVSMRPRASREKFNAAHMQVLKERSIAFRLSDPETVYLVITIRIPRILGDRLQGCYSSSVQLLRIFFFVTSRKLLGKKKMNCNLRNIVI